MSVNILVLASSIKSGDQQGKKFCPSLAEFDGISILEKVIFNTRNIKENNFVFTGLESDLKFFKLENIISILLPDANIISTNTRTAGSLCTALLAASTLNQDDELLIISMNELVNIDYLNALKNFRDNSYTGGVITFDSINPRYSFARLEESIVTEITQYDPISKHATTGSFWFKSTREFVENAKLSILKGVSYEGSYYIAPVYNELILADKCVGAYEIQGLNYYPLKNEVQLNALARRPENGVQ